MPQQPAGEAPSEELVRFRQELYGLCIRGLPEGVAALLGSVESLQGGNPKTQAYVSELDQEGNSALHLATRHGHQTLVTELLQSGCEPNVRDGFGLTPLHVASSEGYAALAAELLGAKANANLCDATHETALHKAVAADAVEVLDVLLQPTFGGADATIGNETQTTPALLAAERGKLTSLQVLLRHDPTLAAAQNVSGWTPLHLAAHGDTHPRKITVAKPPKFLACVKALLEAKAAVDARDEDSKTPLHRAAATGNVDSSQALLEAGGEVAPADICRWTPLHYASQEGHLKVAQLLLISKAPVQSSNPSCQTPLGIATLENQVPMAELLMKHGADPTLGAKGMASPMMIARKEKEKYSDLLSLYELGYVQR